MHKLPRVIHKEGILAFGGFALAMMFAVLYHLCDLSFETTPLYGIVISCMILLSWFCFTGYMTMYGLTALQTIEIDRDEIRICIGRFVLRRIKTDSVKTVGIGAARSKYKRYGLYHGTIYLALSKDTVDELNKKGKHCLHSLSTKRAMDFAPVLLDGPNAAAKSYLLNHYLNGLLWIEWSREAEAALRQCLSTSIFLV